VHAAKLPERSRVIVNRRDSAVGDFRFIQEVRAGVCASAMISLAHNSTFCPCGARMRNAICRSGETTGETTTGPCGPRPPLPLPCGPTGAGA